MRGAAGTALGAIRSPAHGMGEAAGRGAVPGLLTVALWAVATLLVAGLGLLLGGFVSAEELLGNLPSGSLPQGLDEQSLQGIAVGFQVIGIGLRALWPFLYWAALTLVMYLASRLFGGTGALSAMFGAMGVACLPFVVSALVQLPLIGLRAALASGGQPGSAGAALATAGTILSLAFVVWHVALVVVGGAVARGIGYGRSAGSCLTSLAAVVGIPLLLLVLFAVLLAVFGSLGG